jgi:inner membrane transporter RhtA
VAAVLAALVGVVLICEVLTVPWASLDLAGIGLAATAGACWAAYILLSGRAGARFAGLDGIAISMAVAAVLALPLGLVAPGDQLVGMAAVVAAGVLVLGRGSGPVTRAESPEPPIGTDPGVSGTMAR